MTAGGTLPVYITLSRHGVELTLDVFSNEKC
jgi:hypothetical protein